MSYHLKIHNLSFGRAEAALVRKAEDCAAAEVVVGTTVPHGGEPIANGTSELAETDIGLGPSPISRSSSCATLPPRQSAAVAIGEKSLRRPFSLPLVAPAASAVEYKESVPSASFASEEAAETDRSNAPSSQ